MLRYEWLFSPDHHLFSTWRFFFLHLLLQKLINKLQMSSILDLFLCLFLLFYRKERCPSMWPANSWTLPCYLLPFDYYLQSRHNPHSATWALFCISTDELLDSSFMISLWILGQNLPIIWGNCNHSTWNICRSIFSNWCATVWQSAHTIYVW